MFYLFRFKMIDEANAITENLIKCLKDCLKNNKKKFKKEESVIEEENNNTINNNDKEESNRVLLINNPNEELSYNEVYNQIEVIYKKIKKNMKNIDLITIATIRIFRPWK